MVENTPDGLRNGIENIRNDVLASGTIPEVRQLIAPETSAPTQGVETEALNNASASVVQILGAAEQCGYTSTGSGFVVDHGLIATNAHVLSGVNSPNGEGSARAHLAGRGGLYGYCPGILPLSACPG